jgi:Xaa-Pro dipeptidase
MHLYDAAAPALIAEASGGESIPAGDLLARLRAVLTPREVERVRIACRIAGAAFARGAAGIVAGRTEAAVAADFQTGLLAPATDGVARTEGFAFCMAGAHAAQAGAAYARSRFDPLRADELALVHANSTADGYWTDITRTYCLDEPTARQHALFEAIFAAREAALAAIRPGVCGGAVDRAAREELATRGFGAAFTHGTGHGVGFAAIDAGAPPRLRPDSADVLEPGMVCNIEPAIYLAGECGLRHCDVVTVTDDGRDVLTPFQSELADLALTGAASAR